MASCSRTTTGKDDKASHKTVLKWEKEFETKFDCDLSGKDVIRLRCTLCTKWEKRTCSIANFSYNYARPGTTSIKKNSIKLHCVSEPHKGAADLELKSKLGAIPDMELVIENTPIRRSIRRMCAEDENACGVLFNSTYYLVKQERPLSDFPNLLKLQEKNCTLGTKECYRNFLDVIGKVTMDSLQKDLVNAHYFCILNDGSTNRKNL